MLFILWLIVRNFVWKFRLIRQNPVFLAVVAFLSRHRLIVTTPSRWMGLKAGCFSHSCAGDRGGYKDSEAGCLCRRSGGAESYAANILELGCLC